MKRRRNKANTRRIISKPGLLCLAPHRLGVRLVPMRPRNLNQAVGWLLACVIGVRNGRRVRG